VQVCLPGFSLVMRLKLASPAVPGGNRIGGFKGDAGRIAVVNRVIKMVAWLVVFRPSQRQAGL
jgi:hypothetical protein